MVALEGAAQYPSPSCPQTVTLQVTLLVLSGLVAAGTDEVGVVYPPFLNFSETELMQ